MTISESYPMTVIKCFFLHSFVSLTTEVGWPASHDWTFFLVICYKLTNLGTFRTIVNFQDLPSNMYASSRNVVFGSPPAQQSAEVQGMMLSQAPPPPPSSSPTTPGWRSGWRSTMTICTGKSWCGKSMCAIELRGNWILVNLEEPTDRGWGSR